MSQFYPIQFSYTSIDQYKNCPESMRQIYVVKAVKKTFTPQITDGVDAHKELDLRIRTKQSLPAALAKAEPLVQSLERVGEVESEVSLGVDHHWNPATFWNAWLRGKFDVVVRDRSRRKAVIGDWKTGKVHEKGDQLEIGAVLLMQNDPEIDSVTGFNIWLQPGRIGTPYTFVRGDGRTARLTKHLREIESLKSSEAWPKQPGPLCSWCPVKSCEHYRGG